MAMTPSEWLEFLETQVSHDSEFINQALLKGDEALIGLNIDLGIQRRFEIALLHWRNSEYSKTVHWLRKVIELAESCIGKLSGQISPPYTFINTSLPLFASVLLQKSISIGVSLPTAENWFNGRHFEDFEMHLSGSLYQFIATGAQDPSVERILNFIQNRKRFALMHATYVTYFRIASAGFAGDSSIFVDSFRTAEQLYLNRKNNSFYSGGLTIMGGGQANQYSSILSLALCSFGIAKKYQRFSHSNLFTNFRRKTAYNLTSPPPHTVSHALT